MEITLLYKESYYIGVKKRKNIQSWDQQNEVVMELFIMRFHSIWQHVNFMQGVHLQGNSTLV